MKNLSLRRISLVLISCLAFVAAAWLGRSLVDYLVNGRSSDQVESSESLSRAIFLDPTKPPAENGEPAPKESKIAIEAEPADFTDNEKESDSFAAREAEPENETGEAEEETPTSNGEAEPESATELGTVPTASRIDLITEADLPSESPDSSESEDDSAASSGLDGSDPTVAESTGEASSDPEKPGDPENPGEPGEDPPAENLVSGETELNISGGGLAANANAGLAAGAESQDDPGLEMAAEVGVGVEAEPEADADADAVALTSDAVAIPVVKAESQVAAPPANQGADQENEQPQADGRVIIGGRNSRGSASLYSNALGGSVSGLIGGLEPPDSSSSSRVTFRPHVVTSQFERANPALPAVPVQNGIVPGASDLGIPAGAIPILPAIIPQGPVITANPSVVSPSVSGGGGNSPISITVPVPSAGTGASPGGGTGSPGAPIIPGVNGNVGGLNLNLDIKVP